MDKHVGSRGARPTCHLMAVSIGKLLAFSDPQYLHLYDGNINNYLTVWVCILNKTKYNAWYSVWHIVNA